MGLKGKMIGQTEIKSSGGDMLHDVFKQRPHDLATMTPEKIQGFNLLEGGLGTAGSVISWNYFLDGKDRVAKEVIEEIDEEKQSMRFKIIEGDLMELYKSFIVIYHVDTKGEDNLITLTLEYEKLHEDIPHPGTLLNFFLHMVEDIKAHHLKKT